jgi:legumain
MCCSDKADLTEETLEKQYELVKRRTSNNFTYNMGSHVMQFGSLSIDEEPVADYMGELNTGVSLIVPRSLMLVLAQRL